MPEAYRIFETDVFLDDLAGLPGAIREKISSKLRAQVYALLRQQPYFGRNIRKLVNYQPPTWRYRIGNYRLFYGIDDRERVVSILTLADRKDAY